MSLRVTSELKRLPTRQLLDVYDGRPEICPVCGFPYRLDVTGDEYGRGCPDCENVGAWENYSARRDITEHRAPYVYAASDI